MARIEHFALYAADAPALKDFYVTAFGLRVVQEGKGDPPGFFLADDRGVALEIIGRPEGITPVPQRYVCHLAFWVEDVEATRRALEARGLTFETETAVDKEDLRTAFFSDPEGNRCQIVWRARPLGAGAEIPDASSSGSGARTGQSRG